MDAPIVSAPLIRKHFELIGKVVVYWSQIELGSAALACALARLKGAEALITMSQLSSPGQLSVLKMYTDLLPLSEELRKELWDLYGQIEDFRKGRNRIAHGLINENDIVARIIAYDLRNGRLRTRTLSDLELYSLADLGREIVSRLFVLKEKAENDLGSKDLKLALLEQARQNSRT